MVRGQERNGYLIDGFGCPQSAEAGGVENMAITLVFQHRFGLAGPIATTAIKNHLALPVFTDGGDQFVGFIPLNIDRAIHVTLGKFFF